ncbi:hypothetical protein ACO2Q0_02895 [Phenylobacterium sp. VNQ135]|uniref:hypothetical protein n=1 Tax=Phenylobacterium sp. VNQ135 TaxID=3400922 RepID=UPI003BFB0615
MSRDSMSFQRRGFGFVPTRRFAEAFDERFADGAVYWLTEEPERTERSHNHEFAFIATAWKTLPDHLAAEYPSSEALRKRALIATGWCTVQDYVCGSKAEAARWAANLRREVDEYALVVVSESVVRVFRARSQSRKAMGGVDFAKSKSDVLHWISDLIGVSPEQLSVARAA